MRFVFLTVSPLQDEIFPSDGAFLSSVPWLTQGLRAIRIGDLCTYTYLVVSGCQGLQKVIFMGRCDDVCWTRIIWGANFPKFWKCVGKTASQQLIFFLPLILKPYSPSWATSWICSFLVLQVCLKGHTIVQLIRTRELKKHWGIWFRLCSGCKFCSLMSKSKRLFLAEDSAWHVGIWSQYQLFWHVGKHRSLVGHPVISEQKAEDKKFWENSGGKKCN